MLCCTRHLSAVRAVWSALSTQCTVNLEHSNALSTQCTRSNGHSALSATHLIGTECSVRASCVVPCAREPRRPPWASLSLSLPLTRALPRLDLPVSVLACDVRKPIETFGRELESVVPRLKTQKKKSDPNNRKTRGHRRRASWRQRHPQRWTDMSSWSSSILASSRSI
jgi:hypothetical protein